MTKLIARIALIAFFGLLAAAQSWAQYPTRAIRLIVPAAPGGGTDITARSFVPQLSENLGQPVVIENRGGAGGVIGTDVVAKAAPDGYTLLMAYVSHATNPTLVTKLPYDTLRDFEPITLIAHEPTVLVTNPSVPASTLAEFIAWARERDGTLSYATDPGSAGFLAGELFLQRVGLKVQYIPYKGSGPAAADVIAGHVPYMWSVISIVTPHARNGRLKPLSIAAERRAPEACLVNFYACDAKMGLHQDRDEAELAAPVVSISLGDSCCFRYGGLRRGDPAKKLELRSGDIVVMGGSARLMFHGVQRIYSGTSGLLAGGGRINLTLRRVRLPGPIPDGA